MFFHSLDNNVNALADQRTEIPVYRWSIAFKIPSAHITFVHRPTKMLAFKWSRRRKKNESVVYSYEIPEIIRRKRNENEILKGESKRMHSVACINITTKSMNIFSHIFQYIRPCRSFSLANIHRHTNTYEATTHFRKSIDFHTANGRCNDVVIVFHRIRPTCQKDYMRVFDFHVSPYRRTHGKCMYNFFHANTMTTHYSYIYSKQNIQFSWNVPSTVSIHLPFNTR